MDHESLARDAAAGPACVATEVPIAVAVERVTKRYALGKTTVHALRGVDLSVRRGELLVIAGPSGSGKTTLLNLMGCIETPTSGVVRIDGQDTSSLPEAALADLRARKLGYIFQAFNLLPMLTAIENVEYPLFLQPLSRDERRTKAEAALRSVGLASFARHRPLELSGGQRQRVAVARAVVASPTAILADEPTANLDRATGKEILLLLRTMNREHGTTIILSTHDPEVMRVADRVVTLTDGAVSGSPC